MKRFLQCLAEIALVFVFMLCLLIQTDFAMDNESASSTLMQTRTFLSIAITGIGVIFFCIYEIVKKIKDWCRNRIKHDKE